MLGLRFPMRGLGGGDRVPAALSLDFTAPGASLDSRITFTRASSAKRFSASGAIETLGSDVARLDYDPVTRAPRGLLIEDARTNSTIYSQAFTNAAWSTPTNATVTDNAAAAPDGTTTAAALIESSATGLHALDSPGFVFSTGVTYTISLFVKAVGARDVELGFPATVFTSRFARFNLATGAVRSSDAGVTAFIQAVGGGVYRVSATAVCASGASSRFSTFINTQAGSRSYTGDGSSGLQIWGAQLEVGSEPSSYISTTSAAATRAVDLATVATASFPFSADAGALLLWHTPRSVTGTLPIISLDDGTSNERIRLINDAGTLKAQIVDGGVTQADISLGAVSIGTAYRIAVAWAPNDIAACVNGGSVSTDVSATLPTVTTLTLGQGWHATAAYFPRRLSNAELQARTA